MTTNDVELQDVIRLAKATIVGNHFMFRVHSLMYYSIYRNRDFIKRVCEEIEKMGYSVRCGLAHNYYLGQGLQEYIFECSKNTKFSFMFSEDYGHELIKDSNIKPQ